MKVEYWVRNGERSLDIEVLVREEDLVVGKESISVSIENRVEY